MTYVFMLIPVLFLVGSIFLSIIAVKRGTKTKKAILIQTLSFLCVSIICVAAPIAASAKTSSDSASQTTSTSDVATTEAKDSSLGFGLGLIAAALVTSVSGIGGGIAVAAAAPAAVAATSEDPKSFGKALIFVALGEGIALYGLLVSILILAKL